MSEPNDPSPYAPDREIVEVPRHRRLLEFSPELLARFLSTGTGMVEILSNPLPADVRIVDVRLDRYRPAPVIVLLLESEAFGPVPEGEQIPRVESPVFKAVDQKGE